MRLRGPRNLGSLTVSAAIAVGASLGLLAPAALAAPPNDDFANRAIIPSTLPAEAEGSSVGATAEPGEWIGEVMFEAHKSVWWEWEAPSTQIVSIGTCGTDFEAMVGVFTSGGSSDPLRIRVVPGHEAAGSDCASRHSFRAVAGTRYEIGVEGGGDGPIPEGLPPGPPPNEGTVKLQITATPSPANDDFADATPISGFVWEAPGGSPRQYVGSAEGYSWGATTEPGEPVHAGAGVGASVWYRWTPSESGPAIVAYCCSEGHGALAVYTGSTLGGLVPVASTSTEPFYGLRFDAVAGREYLIAVAGLPLEDGEPWMGNFYLTLLQGLTPGASLPPVDGSTPNQYTDTWQPPPFRPSFTPATHRASDRKVSRERRRKARHARRAKRHRRQARRSAATSHQRLAG